MKMKQRNSGFTLIEIMVVVAIIGILLAMVAPNIVGRSDEARVVKAQSDVLTLETQMDIYRLDNGFYPSQEQGLDALVQRPATPPEPRRWKQGGYIRRLPDDPWGNSYQYRNPGIFNEIDIFSLGANGVEGGDDFDAEIGNWN